MALVAIVIILFANSLFDLTPYSAIPGKFRMSDVGIGILFVVLAYTVIFRSRQSNQPNLFSGNYTILIWIYLLIVVVEIAMASMIFDQTIVDGLIRGRQQLYHFSYFVFLTIFLDQRIGKRFFVYLTAVSVILVLLIAINYFVSPIFYHKWAEGHGIRGGIKRAITPGLEIIIFCAYYYLARILSRRKIDVLSLTMVLICSGAILIGQTRAHIIAFAIVLIGYVFTRSKLLALSVSLSVTVLAVTAVIFQDQNDAEQNIILYQFSSAYEEITNKTGNWAPRNQQLESDIEIFMDYPILGSGGLVLRDKPGKIYTNREREARVSASYGSDLGYSSIAKYFGIVGLVWVFAVFVVTVVNYFTGKKANNYGPLEIAAFLMLIHIAISEVTLDFVFTPHRMVILDLAIAIIMAYLYRESRMHKYSTVTRSG